MAGGPEPGSIAETGKNGSAETTRFALFPTVRPRLDRRVNAAARKIIAALELAPLPREGGWFRQVWQSPETHQPGRSAGSAIYFLLTDDDFSALHRLQTAEIWHFYAGDPVLHWQLDPADGTSASVMLGPDVLRGQVPQLVVHDNIWQGARIIAGGPPGPSTSLRAGWALLGCTMAPAWDEREFELGERAALLREFPTAAVHIRALTR
jgi:predicted cupin superfamily sugar epimerase